MQLAKRVLAVKPSATLAISAQAKELRKKGENVINLSAGEPDFATPDYIKDAAINALKENFTKYTDTAGIKELREKISLKLKKDNDLNYSPREIIVSTGAKQALYNALMVLCNPGDEVIIPAPYWVSYPEMVRLVEAIPVVLPTKNFRIEPEKLERKITKKTKVIILNSPANPTGVVYKKEELEEIAEIIVRHNVHCLSDEIYEKIIYDRIKHISIATLNDKIKNLTILINGFSKSYAMTGWRLGYAAGNKEIIAGMKKLQSHSTSCPNSIAQKAALAALGGNQSEVERMRKEFEKRRNFLTKRLNEIKGIIFSEPEGAFYTFLSHPQISDSLNFAKELLEKEKLAVVPGIGFGKEGYLRISFAASLREIGEGIKRLKRFIENS